MVKTRAKTTTPACTGVAAGAVPPVQAAATAEGQTGTLAESPLAQATGGEDSYGGITSETGGASVL